MNNSDPDGLFAISTRFIASFIDFIISGIPALLSLNSLLRTLKNGRKLANIGHGVWIHVFKIGTEKIVSRLGLKKAIAWKIVGLLNLCLKAVTHLSIGNLFIFALKFIVKTQKRKEREYVFFGPQIDVDYFIF